MDGAAQKSSIEAAAAYAVFFPQGTKPMLSIKAVFVRFVMFVMTVLTGCTGFVTSVSKNQCPSPPQWKGDILLKQNEKGAVTEAWGVTHNTCGKEFLSPLFNRVGASVRGNMTPHTWMYSPTTMYGTVVPRGIRTITVVQVGEILEVNYDVFCNLEVSPFSIPADHRVPSPHPGYQYYSLPDITTLCPSPNDVTPVLPFFSPNPPDPT